MPTTLVLLQCCHHDHRHGNELSTWKQRDLCSRAQKGNEPNVSVPVCVCTHTQTHMILLTCAHTGLESMRCSGKTSFVRGFSWRTETENKDTKTCWQKQSDLRSVSYFWGKASFVSEREKGGEYDRNKKSWYAASGRLAVSHLFLYNSEGQCKFFTTSDNIFIWCKYK